VGLELEVVMTGFAGWAWSCGSCFSWSQRLKSYMGRVEVEGEKWVEVVIRLYRLDEGWYIVVLIEMWLVLRLGLCRVEG